MSYNVAQFGKENRFESLQVLVVVASGGGKCNLIFTDEIEWLNVAPHTGGPMGANSGSVGMKPVTLLQL